MGIVGASPEVQAAYASVPPDPISVIEAESNDTQVTAQAVASVPATVSGSLGSTADIDYYLVSVPAGRTLTVTLTAAGGRAVPGLVVTAVVGRPATNREDRPVVLAETEPGTYVGRVAALDAGAWLVAVEALQEKQSVDPVYRAGRRLWIRP